MMIVKYGFDGMKCVLQEGASRADLSARYRRWLKKAEADDDMYVTWHGCGFEVENDRWAAGFVIRGRPDNWSLINGEPV